MLLAAAPPPVSYHTSEPQFTFSGPFGCVPAKVRVRIDLTGQSELNLGQGYKYALTQWRLPGLSLCRMQFTVCDCIGQRNLSFLGL